jgi:hypothetical protein
MGRKEFEWDGDDFHSVWDDFTPMRKSAQPTAQTSWGSVLPEVRLHSDQNLTAHGLEADVTLPNGDVLHDVPVFIPGSRRAIIEALGGFVLQTPENPPPFTYTVQSSASTTDYPLYFASSESEEEQWASVIPDEPQEPPIVYDMGPTWDNWDAVIPLV